MRVLSGVLLGLSLGSTGVLAQTDGGATFNVRINDYNGTGTKHWTVAWVASASGTFIKTLRKQGPTITSTHWSSHCGVWYAAKAGSTALDGYSTATAQDYTGTNSPVIWTWNCRDANNNLVADGNYVFWVQYAEDNGQGPYTTNGLAWTKGPVASTTNYPNLGTTLTGLSVVWTPAPPPPPQIISVQLNADKFVLSGSGTANGTYSVVVSTDPGTPKASWTSIATNTIDAAGHLSFTNTISPAVPRQFYRLRAP